MAKPKPSPKPKTKTVIQPSIREEGKPHAFETMFKGKPELLPELRSIGYAKLPDENTWVSYVITTKGNEVLRIEVEEPNVRAIAEEVSKIKFVECFVDQI